MATYIASMIWVWVILLILSPAILYVLAGITLALKKKFLPRCCPACGVRALRSINFIMATVLVNGKRAPDSWEYLLCMSCGKALEVNRGQWETPSPEEKQKYFPRDSRP